MKYTVLTYDMNRPVTKQVSVPLGSRYGVAVEVFKDGQRLELLSGDVMVGGQPASDVRGGYALVDLSSASVPGIYRADVSISSEGAFVAAFPFQVQARDFGYFET